MSTVIAREERAVAADPRMAAFLGARLSGGVPFGRDSGCHLAG